MSGPSYSIGNLGTDLPNISNQIANSPYLAQLLNTFDSKDGNIQVGPPSDGTSCYMTRGGSPVIVIADNLVPPVNASVAEMNSFAVILAHELGHADDGLQPYLSAPSVLFR
jgi:hypothetical protein